MRRLVLACTEQEIASLRPLWEALHASGDSTVFQSFQWNRIAARVFGRRERPFVVAAETDSGAAIIPAALSAGERRLTLLGDQLFDYRDVLWAGDPDALYLAWERIAQLGTPLEVTAVRRGALLDLDCGTAEPYAAAPCVQRDHISESDFVEAHHRLGSRFRKLQRLGARVHRCSGAVSDLVRWIYRRKADTFEGWGENLFADPARVEFMVAAAAAAGTDSDLFTLDMDGLPIAALVTFRDGEVRRFYTTYFDARWAKHSPGMVLLYEVTRMTLAEGFDCDYMTGEQPYKLRLATSSVPLSRVVIPADAFTGAGERLAETAERRQLLVA